MVTITELAEILNSMLNQSCNEQHTFENGVSIVIAPDQADFENYDRYYITKEVFGEVRTKTYFNNEWGAFYNQLRADLFEITTYEDQM